MEKTSPPSPLSDFGEGELGKGAVEAMWDADQDEIVEPFRVTPGFIAFVAAMFVPVIVALVVVIGAALVSSEVYAAEASESRFGNSSCLNCDEDVAGWKRSLVGICPLH